MKLSLLSFLLAVTPFTILAADESTAIADGQFFTDKSTGVTVVKGSIELPRKGSWSISGPYQDHQGLTEIYLASDDDELADFEGERMAKLEDRRVAKEVRSDLWRLHSACYEYASKKEGNGPQAFTDLIKVKVRRNPDTPATPLFDQLKNIALDDFHLVPAVRLAEMPKKDERRPRRVDSNEPLVIELAPAIDDGRHWIMRANGQPERVKIDPKLVEKFKLKISPKAPSHLNRVNNGKSTRRHDIIARFTGDPDQLPATVQLEAIEFYADQSLKVTWPLAKAQAGDTSIVGQWAEQRLWNLEPGLSRGAPIARHWFRATGRQYELSEEIHEFFPDLLSPPNRNLPANVVRPRPRSTTGVMAMLGGRAAIDETLQLQDLRMANAKPEDREPTIPIADIEGVTVEAHPFEEMLDGKEGIHLQIADWIPQDRFMVYLPRPEKVFSLLNGGSDFIFQAGSGVTGRSVSHGVKQRYIEQLGLSEKLMQRFLGTGAIEEMALVLPDLFLIDGTDFSVVMRSGKPLLAQTALAMVGVTPGDGRKVTKNARGEAVYWHRRGDILILSTSESEIDALLKTGTEGTEVSLGRSAELRYMLTQAPLNDDTAAFAYFSDPFIRRLVGPEVKIGQRRRMLARAELEEASAASLLASYDGHGAKAFDVEFLKKRDYLRLPIVATDLRIDDRSVSHSKKFGSAPNLRALSELPIELVSAEEKNAYASYRDEYSRYWRRFFDPIALRYDQKADGAHQLETFILPLIDNSLYELLRQFLPDASDPTPLPAPTLEPTPIAQLSFNLSEDAWLGFLEGFYDSFEMLAGLDPALLDLLGPDLHLSLQDADPIISMGNGEIQDMLGQFSGVGGDSEMFVLPMLVSTLTRPCTFHIGLTDPQAARELLTTMAWPPYEEEDAGDIFSGGFGSGSLYQITGEEKWIYRYTIFGLITLRFSIEVQGRYLVINNLPFSNPVKLTGSREAVDGAARFELNPQACAQQLPALFSSAAEQMRHNSVHGAACLMPLLIGESEGKTKSSIDHSAQRLKELFGFTPNHPGGGQWLWNDNLGAVDSSLFGSLLQHQQPSFSKAAEAELGLFKDVPEVSVEMIFEQDGLRSNIRWRVTK
jgi:hypothetical protein